MADEMTGFEEKTKKALRESGFVTPEEIVIGATPPSILSRHSNIYCRSESGSRYQQDSEPVIISPLKIVTFGRDPASMCVYELNPWQLETILGSEEPQINLVMTNIFMRGKEACKDLGIDAHQDMQSGTEYKN